IVADSGDAAIHPERETRRVAGVDADAAEGADQELIGSGGGEVEIGAVAPDEGALMIGPGFTSGGKRIVPGGDVLHAARNDGAETAGDVGCAASDRGYGSAGAIPLTACDSGSVSAGLVVMAAGDGGK